VLLACAVVLVHALLALAAFNPAPHTGGDNAGYVTLAHSLLETGTYTETWDPAGLPHTKYPPVFPALLALWMLFGAKTWIALKSVPMIFSALSVLFAYLWAAGRRGPVFGAAVGVLVGVSSATIDASHWVLSDPTFVAFTLLALCAFERGGVRAAPGAAPSPPRASPSSAASAAGRAQAQDAPASSGGSRGSGWAAAGPALFTLLGGAAALLAYFTRSAGIPLLIAIGAWLLLRRRWRALAVYAAGAGAPLLLWWLRTRRVGQASYMNEFWLVDPYDPSLGRIAPAGLVGRIGVNLVGYVTRHVPGGIVGAQGAWVAALGVALVALALVGWVRALRRDLGVAELFVPLYLGLIFVWPAVWSGDRFALPLYALLFYYAGDALLALGSRAGKGAALGVALVAFLLLAGPAVGAWTRAISVARICRSAALVEGPFGCWGAGVNELVRVAMWSRSALPEGSAVLSRKPRIFYVMSGVRSRTFPFSVDPEVLLAEARATGARYVLLDQWDGQAMRFVGEAIAQRPQAFCAVGGFDPREGAAGTLLLGIRTDLPPAPSAPPTTQISLERCPPEMLGDIEAPIPTYSTSAVPLLSSGDAEP
jgi:hypothetical protein